MKRVLTVAGSDSGGGAGIQADLKTFSAFGVYGACAVTSITVQNTLGVQSVHPLPPALVKGQMEAVLGDIGADAVKTGMLCSGPIVAAVADVLEAAGPIPLVVDPVMASKNGIELLDREGRRRLIERLLPICTLFIPNLPEAETILDRSIRDLKGMKAAAADLAGLGGSMVLIKGGHLAGDPLDLLFDGQEFHTLPGKRIETPHTHGTGCTFSAALAAGLALGLGVGQAAQRAKDYVLRAIQNAPGLGSGKGPLFHGADA